MKTINDIFGKYTSGEATLEETNAALAAEGSSLRLDPGKSALTEQERSEAIAGETAAEANGYGLLDMGLGTPGKVQVKNGKLADSDVGGMRAFCTIGGKTYRVEGDTLKD